MAGIQGTGRARLIHHSSERISFELGVNTN